MCAVVLPERITLDEWGYPVIEPGPIPERLLSPARRAVDVCPVLALSLRQVQESRGGTGSPDQLRHVWMRGSTSPTKGHHRVQP